MPETLTPKLQVAANRLRELGSVLVAFSGGVDSSLLLALAIKSLGRGKVLAVTAVGPVTTAEDRVAAVDVARLTKAQHQLIYIDHLAIPGFAQNSPERCYLCRQRLFAELEMIRASADLTAIVDGAIVEDTSDYRPGHRAAREAGIIHPLAEAGLTKMEVREASRQWHLPTADRPASPCLASRFPYGEPLTKEALTVVGQAEALLHRWGFPVARVRHHGLTARIEVPPNQIERLATEPLRSQLVENLHRLGYVYICLDLAGFRPGSLNEALDLPKGRTAHVEKSAAHERTRAEGVF